MDTPIYVEAFPVNDYDNSVDSNNKFQMPVVRNPDRLCQFLTNHSWPKHMQDFTIAQLEKHPLRYFIYDDSGSMQTYDGNKYVTMGIQNHPTFMKCSRWDELKEVIKFQMNFCREGEINAKFLFLNSSTVSIDNNNYDSPYFDKIIMDKMTLTGGATPLCAKLQTIIDDLNKIKDELIAANKKVTLFIATDGEASDGKIECQLQQLYSMPVHIVLRLCTDSETVVKYWNDIDNNLELHMDVLDDFLSEAKEVYCHNKWLVYDYCIHQLREIGLSMVELDLLDERELSFNEKRNIAIMLYGNAVANANENFDILSLKQPNRYCTVLRRYKQMVTLKTPSQCTIC